MTNVLHITLRCSPSLPDWTCHVLGCWAAAAAVLRATWRVLCHFQQFCPLARVVRVMELYGSASVSSAEPVMVGAVASATAPLRKGSEQKVLLAPRMGQMLRCR